MTEQHNKCEVGGASSNDLTCYYKSVTDLGLTPGLGRSPGERHGNSLQYSCLENPMDGGHGMTDCVVHRVTESQTGLKRRSIHTST